MKKRPPPPECVIKRQPDADGSDASDSPFAGLTPKQRAFLGAYSVCGDISTAREIAGIGYWTHSEWHKRQPRYREAFKVAKQIAADEIEAAAVRRAVQGTRRFKFHQGKPVMVPNPATGEPEHYYDTEYADTLMLAMLKATKPEKYRERQHIQTSIENDHRVAGLAPEEVRQKMFERLKELADTYQKS